MSNNAGAQKTNLLALEKFFLVVPPGFESIARDELQAVPSAPARVLAEEKGGLLIEASLLDGLALNHMLKIPSRILLRISDFGCRDFPKLFKKMQQPAWESFLPDPDTAEISVSSHASRLKIKKRIEKTCRDGLRARFRKNPPAGVGEARKRQGPEAGGAVFVRVFNDVCTISLDTSGEHLHKRGYRVHASAAPLRENLAAGLLRHIALGADGGARVELCDPMMGSGTFLLEAARLSRGAIEEERDFSYRGFPFLAGQVDQVRDRARSWAPPRAPFTALRGWDASQEAVRIAGHNRGVLGLAEKDALFSVGDLFELEECARPGAGTERWVVCNAPYGERIRIEGGLTDFYSRLLFAAERVFRPDRGGFLLSAKVSMRNLRIPSAWELREPLVFSNGGLPVVFLAFRRRAGEGPLA